MFSLPSYVENLRRETRKLRIYSQQLERSITTQKKNNKIIEEEKTIIQRKNRDLEKENKRLKDELEKARLTIDSYKRMLFHANKHTDVEQPDQKTGDQEQKVKPQKIKAGQKKGHKGYGRKTSSRIDQRIGCFMSACPDCGIALQRGESSRRHVVLDIPNAHAMQPITTEYKIERQWCGKCHKVVSGIPFGVLPGARLGMNLFLMVLIWRYHLRLPFNRIVEILSIHYGILLSGGALVGMVKRARMLFGKRYDDLLIEIRGSPVKHADETSWGMNGELYWCWVFLTTKSVYYTIEETRGKGTPERVLKDAIGVLVRDGYTAYEKLPLAQQACFAHVYRKAREAAERKGASDEAIKLFAEIKMLYGLLAEDIQRPFDKTDREELFITYKTDLKKITTRAYQSEDARRVQAYITNLGDNLLTALLHAGVPLTNNPAEQAERQIVVGRKISGGSRSKEGAKTHAVNMSITQTILKQKLPLLATLESYLLESIPRSVVKN